jgi:hypothetical protein
MRRLKGICINLFGIALLTLGLVGIGVSGPWQVCDPQIEHTGTSVCTAPEPFDCGICYRDEWTDWNCSINLSLWCHLDENIQIEVTRKYYDCVLINPGNCYCNLSNYSHQTTYQWAGGESCFNTGM